MEIKGKAVKRMKMKTLSLPQHRKSRKEAGNDVSLWVFSSHNKHTIFITLSICCAASHVCLRLKSQSVYSKPKYKGERKKTRSNSLHTNNNNKNHSTPFFSTVVVSVVMCLNVYDNHYVKKFHHSNRPLTQSEDDETFQTVYACECLYKCH